LETRGPIFFFCWWLNACMSREQQNSALEFSDAARSGLSLALFIYLFLVVMGLVGNESVSVLFNRMRQIPGLSAVSCLLNLDPQFRTGFHLTHAMDFEDDHQLAVEVPAQPARVWPPAKRGVLDPRGGFQRQRWLTLTRRVGMMVANEDDQGVAELARTIATDIFAETDAKQLVLSCRRYQPQDLMGPDDASLEPQEIQARFETIYTADVILDESGVVRVNKRVSSTDAAQVRP